MEIISSRKNESVRFLRELIREKKLRDELGMFAAEGDHLCGMLDRAELFAFTEKAEKKYPQTVRGLCGRSEKTIVISEELSEYISDTKAPQGLFAAAKKRSFGLCGNARRVIVLDGVQDSGNVGTIIRTADAFSFDGVVLLGGCADVYSPKTLRASMGSVFGIPTVLSSAEKLRELLPDFRIFASALNKDNNIPLNDVRFEGKSAVIVGSEGGGISREALLARTEDKTVYIPCRTESLNVAVAAALIMHRMCDA